MHVCVCVCDMVGVGVMVCVGVGAHAMCVLIVAKVKFNGNVFGVCNTHSVRSCIIVRHTFISCSKT